MYIHIFILDIFIFILNIYDLLTNNLLVTFQTSQRYCVYTQLNVFKVWFGFMAYQPLRVIKAKSGLFIHIKDMYI